MYQRNLVFVLGMGRSGTSALTRVLSLCGCVVPEAVWGAVSFNSTGLWEPVEAARLNHEFLRQHGLKPLDSSMRIQDFEFAESAKQSFVQDIRLYLRDAPSGAALVIKDLTIVDLWEFWLEAATSEGFVVHAVIAIRHPSEVFASMAGIGKPLEWASAEWVKRNLLAERHTRDLPRVFVEYSNLLKDWRFEIARVSKALAIDLDVEGTNVDDFINPDLRHQYNTGGIAEPFGHAWISTIYDILSAASKDIPVGYAVLDDIFHVYHASARTFRVMMDCILNSPPLVDFNDLRDRASIWRSGSDF